MPETRTLTLGVAVNDPKLLNGNLLLSPGVHDACQIVVETDHSSASSAYNACIAKAKHDLIVLAHQDIYFPFGWFERLHASIEFLDDQGIRWGVLGSYGVGPDRENQAGCVYQNGMGTVGRSLEQPEAVQTLDEIVLVIRKSSGLMFDAKLPHFHLYGADICMQANTSGLACYAIPGFCVHNTHQIIRLPPEYWECYGYFKQKWGTYLPVQTSCIEISRYDRERWLRHLRHLKNDLLHVSASPAKRLEDPREALDRISLQRRDSR